MLNNQEIKVLRDLAVEYAQYATLPEQAERKRLWLALNTGHMERPLVLIDQLPWNELDTDRFLTCLVTDPYWRGVENNLRQTLYKWRHMKADMVLNPYFALNTPVISTDYGLPFIVERIELEKGTTAAAQAFTNQFQSLEDIEKIKDPTIRPDEEGIRRVSEEADRVFEGILPWRFCGGPNFRVGPWDLITMWMGVTDIYIDFIEEPELLHAIMEKMTKALHGLIDQYNQYGLFDVETNICHCSQTFTEDLPTKGGDRAHPQSCDAWGFGLAQLMSSVSPEITREFEVRYMKDVFARMGAVYYGCCEMLDDRLDIIAEMPNIRKISCSPWSNREHFAETMPDWCVMSNKPNPAYLATSEFHLDEARADIQRTIAAAKRYNRRLEMILKDISTCKHEPWRIWQWSEMAVEEAKRSI